MSVTGFDNILFSTYTSPPLTTFDQPKRYIGEEAARLVLELLNLNAATEISGKPKMHKLKGHLVVRGSTASP
jgi:DNA-binding LacI/PurR family transcriptional regulator